MLFVLQLGFTVTIAAAALLKSTAVRRLTLAVSFVARQVTSAVPVPASPTPEQLVSKCDVALMQENTAFRWDKILCHGISSKRWFFGFRCWCQLSLLPTCCIAGECILKGEYDKRQVTHWSSQFPLCGFSFKTDSYGLQTWWLMHGALSRWLKIEVIEHLYLYSSWKGREESLQWFYCFLFLLLCFWYFRCFL